MDPEAAELGVVAARTADSSRVGDAAMIDTIERDCRLNPECRDGATALGAHRSRVAGVSELNSTRTVRESLAQSGVEACGELQLVQLEGDMGSVSRSACGLFVTGAVLTLCVPLAQFQLDHGWTQAVQKLITPSTIMCCASSLFQLGGVVLLRSASTKRHEPNRT